MEVIPGDKYKSFAQDLILFSQTHFSFQVIFDDFPNIMF